MPNRILTTMFLICFASMGQAQHAMRAASELDQIWSFLNDGHPYLLQMTLTYSETDYPGEEDTNRVVVYGVGNDVQYTLDDDVLIAASGGLKVQVSNSQKTVYITEDTFKRSSFSGFGVFQILTKDSSKYECKVSDTGTGKRKIEYRIPGSANPYTAFYYSVPSYIPDSAEMDLVLEYDPYERKASNTATLRVYYEKAGPIEKLPYKPGVHNVLTRTDDSWLLKEPYRGYRIHYTPVITFTK